MGREPTVLWVGIKSYLNMQLGSADPQICIAWAKGQQMWLWLHSALLAHLPPPAVRLQGVGRV